MLESNKQKRLSAVVWVSVIPLVIMVLALGRVDAQDPLLLAPQSTPPDSAIPFGSFRGALSVPMTASAGSTRWQGNNSSAAEVAGSAGSTARKPGHVEGIRRITLEQAKQQRSVDSVASPLARLGQLSIEAAKQHRLGVQADYFPKLGATFANLHYSEFLGDVISFRRPIQGSLVQAQVPLFSQNQTIAAVTFIQPITPLFQVNQDVRIARADERIALAKAGVAVTKNARDIEVEEAYFGLLIAQRRLTSADAKLRSAGNRELYASASIEVVRASSEAPELVEAQKALVTAATAVREQNALLNRLMGWPDDTELELVPPDPLVENISLQEIADKPSAANPDVIEAEQTVVKARAASALSKLAYVPTVAAVGGYLFQNAIPLVPSEFGYGGVMVSYNIFDFGKRERAVKEAFAQKEMAEIALQLTEAKVAASLKKSYFELERTRQLSQVAQKMGSSVAQLMNVSSTSESIETKAARSEVEIEMLQADLAHRQAFARLKALMGPQQ